MDQSLTDRKVEINFAAQFPKAVQAEHQGEPVRISHLADAEGMSPVFLIIDSSGKTAWVPQREVTITDSDYLPSSSQSSGGLSSQLSRSKEAATSR